MHKSIYPAIALPLSLAIGQISSAATRDSETRLIVGAEVVAPCAISAAGANPEQSGSVIACVGNRNASFRSTRVPGAQVIDTSASASSDPKLSDAQRASVYHITEISF